MDSIVGAHTELLVYCVARVSYFILFFRLTVLYSEYCACHRVGDTYYRYCPPNYAHPYLRNSDAHFFGENIPHHPWAIWAV